jgi:endonuclease-3 related protein
VPRIQPKNSDEAQVREIFALLYRAWGRQHWWPAESSFEVVVGTFLTQNTAWTNVERALDNLRAANALSVEGIRRIPGEGLERLIRPAGYFRQKSQRLKRFVAYLDEKYGGSLQQMFARPTEELRGELLGLNGVGPETADSILLYAGQHEVFVVDAYTRRILDRHGILPETTRYEEIRSLFELALSPDFTEKLMAESTSIEERVEGKPPGAHHAPSAISEAKRSPRAQAFNELHGLIVGVGKNHCQARRVLCDQCPLQTILTEKVRFPKKVSRPRK